MAATPPDAGSNESAHRGSAKAKPAVITTARFGSSREMASREKRYAITMGIRTACFVSMIFVSGPFRWVLLAGAVFLPYIAVVLANQANTRTKGVRVEQSEASRAPQLTADAAGGEVVEGELVSDDDWDGRERVA